MLQSTDSSFVEEPPPRLHDLLAPNRVEHRSERDDDGLLLDQWDEQQVDSPDQLVDLKLQHIPCPTVYMVPIQRPTEQEVRPIVYAELDLPVKPFSWKDPTAPPVVSPLQDEMSRAHRCWGGVLKGDDSECTLCFIPKSSHFADKFCTQCRSSGFVLKGHVRALPKETTAKHDVFRNVEEKGFWNQRLQGVHTRIVNNGSRCTGPELVLFRKPVPPWALELTEPVANEDGLVLRVGLGTLVPIELKDLHDEDLPRCWGGVIKGNDSECTLGFIPKSSHFADKFCAQCRSSGFVLKNRVRALPKETTAKHDVFKNGAGKGFWNQRLQGVRTRIVNNGSRSTGPELVMFDAPVPPWALELTEPVANEVNMRVRCGTLAPCLQHIPSALELPVKPAKDPTASLVVRALPMIQRVGVKRPFLVM